MKIFILRFRRMSSVVAGGSWEGWLMSCFWCWSCVLAGERWIYAIAGYIFVQNCEQVKPLICKHNLFVTSLCKPHAKVKEQSGKLIKRWSRQEDCNVLLLSFPGCYQLIQSIWTISFEVVEGIGVLELLWSLFLSDKMSVIYVLIDDGYQEPVDENEENEMSFVHAYQK